jgi:hypothetical protein
MSRSLLLTELSWLLRLLIWDNEVFENMDLMLEILKLLLTLQRLGRLRI